MDSLAEVHGIGEIPISSPPGLTQQLDVVEEASNAQAPIAPSDQAHTTQEKGEQLDRKSLRFLLIQHFSKYVVGDHSNQRPTSRR